MPVLDLHIAPNIYAWNITEAEEELLGMVNLSEEESERIYSFTRKQRRKELLATRALLGNVVKNEHIHYSNKAPFLVKSRKEISISNSKKIVVIQLNDKGIKTGVDIQYYSEVALKVKGKFMHKNEFSLIEEKNESKIANIIWSAKESLYKAYTENKLNFKSHIEIKLIKEAEITGVIHKEAEEIPFRLGMFLNNDFVLTWFID